jgi:transposase
MYIRRKKNQSGSISIQIAEKIKDKVEIVETVGVARSKGEELALRLKGRERIDEIHGQRRLNFPNSRNQEFFSVLQNGVSLKVINIGPELVLGKIFDRIGLNVIEEPLFRYITLSRLTYPTSKLKTQEYLFLHHGIEEDISKIYRFLDRFHLRYKDKVESIVYEHTCRVLGSIQMVFYDMTTLYFESEDEDDLRKLGFSKEGKLRNPQILLGLLVGENGYPIGYDMYEGNKYEGHTLIPVIERLKKKYKLPNPIIVADSGLLSKTNIDALEKAGYEYIIGARLKNVASGLKEEILTKAQKLSDSEATRIQLKDGRSLIISYSDVRAKKDRHNRDKGLKRLLNQLRNGRLTKEHINKKGYNKFLSIQQDIHISINQDKILEDTKWDGLKGYLTNSSLNAKAVISSYKHLWNIERAFRISKTDLRIRPIYLRKQNRIEAHLCIAFAAYAIYKELERILKANNLPISPAKAIELIKAIYQITFKLPQSNETLSRFSDLTDSQIKILEALGVPR